MKRSCLLLILVLSALAAWLLAGPGYAQSTTIDNGRIEIWNYSNFRAPLNLNALRVAGCTADCQIDSVTIKPFGPVTISNLQLGLATGNVLPFSSAPPIAFTESPLNTGDFGVVVTITGGCSAHLHPHKTVSATIIWHGIPPPIQMEILSAVMRDPYTFDVHLYRDFGNRSLPVRVRYTVNGVPLDLAATLPSSGTRYGPAGQYTADPVSYPFLGVVPRFNSAQAFTVDAMVKIGDWEMHRQKHVYIPLPTVVVPGALPNPLDDATGGNGTFPDLEQEIIRVVGDRNDGNVDPKSMSFTDARLTRLPGEATMITPLYPVVQTVDFTGTGVDRNSCSLGQGGAIVNNTIAALLQNTWAARVNVISHSKGCLTARAAFSQQSSLRSVVANMVMIEGPHAGMPYPFYLDILNSALGGSEFDNLLPTVYNSYKDVDKKRFGAWPTQNNELARLDNHALPPGPNYIVYYSDGSKTLWAVDANRSGHDIQGAGDGRVPVFSQKGLIFDANNPGRQLRPLWAFQDIRPLYVRVPGPPSAATHGATMQNPAFISDLVERLYN